MNVPFLYFRRERIICTIFTVKLRNLLPSLYKLNLGYESSMFPLSLILFELKQEEHLSCLDRGKSTTYSSDSNRQPVAVISNITLLPPSTRSKNDAITSIYISTFSQKYTITLIDTSMQFRSTFRCKFDINESASTA